MTQPKFEDLYRSMDFERPLDWANQKDRALYVPNLHTSEGISPVDELRVNIAVSDRPGTWLFTGHRGVGKSTELRRMAAQLRDAGHVVIVADMGEYLNLGEAISTEVLLLTLVAALADGANQYLDVDRRPEKSSYALRLWDYLKTTEINLTQVGLDIAAGDAAKFSLKTELKQNPSFRQKVLAAVNGSPARLAQQVREFAQVIAQDARSVRGNPNTRVVLILDSLERLRVTGSDAQVCYDAITRTFDVQGEHLKLEHIDVVYSVPPYLPFLVPRIGSYFGVEVCTLPHVKVFETPAPGRLPAAQPVQPCAHGIDLLVQCLRQRYPDVEQLTPLPLLERLALASSGSVRDYLRLIKSVCTKAMVSNAVTPLQGERWAEMAEQVLRNEMPLATDDKKWLQEVRLTHGSSLDSIANLHQLARLFDSGVILNYRNGRDWCEVHALLHDELSV